MGIEYKITFSVPKDFDSASLFQKLPSPINGATKSEIYNFRIEDDGFYFIDHLVDTEVASVAFRRFVDEALKHGASVQIEVP